MEQALLARQPIVDREVAIRAYELLFRSSQHQSAGFDGDIATATVAMSTLLDLGLDAVAGPHPIFVNLTRGFFERELYVALPPDRVVLEVLEDIEPDDVVLAAVARAKALGYKIALDDYVHHERFLPLVELADYVKVDVLEVGQDAAREYVELLKRPGLQLLAEKVETHEGFQDLRDAGYDLFQGWFYARPDLVQRRVLQSDRAALLHLLATLEDPGLDFREIGELVERNLSLSLKLLRYVNSALYGLRTEIDSIRHACTMLGRERVRSCVQLLLLTEVAEKPNVLMVNALSRARLCQLLAGKAGAEIEQQFFTVGLFSMLDAYLDRPLEEILEEVPLSVETKRAILEREGPAGAALKVAVAIERADWESLDRSGVDPAETQRQYLAALDWTRQVHGVIG